MTTIDQNNLPAARKAFPLLMTRQAASAVMTFAVRACALLVPASPDPEKELEKNVRRAAARRAVDNLLR